MLVFGVSLEGREGQSGCVMMRVWQKGCVQIEFWFDWWCNLWEVFTSLRQPDPCWVVEAPEWGVFVSFAVLDLWKDRRAPTLSHLILWLVGRRTRRTRRGHRSLNWTKSQAGRLRRRKAPCNRPPSPAAHPVFRRIRVADALRGALQCVAIWVLVFVGSELGRSAPHVLGCALFRDAEVLGVGVLRGLCRVRRGWRWLEGASERVRRWTGGIRVAASLVRASVMGVGQLSVCAAEWVWVAWSAGGCLAGFVALVGVARPLGWVLLLEVRRVAARRWTRRIGMAFGMLVVSLLVLLSLLWRAVTPWDLRPAPADPEHPISLSPFALTGGCANVNAPAYTEQAVSVDATLAKFGAKRIPNVSTNDCGYVALHLWDHDTQPDVRAMRKQLYDTAVEVSNRLVQVLGSQEAMTEFANGVTGEAHLNHLGLQLTATASRINIVVVQASEENPLVRITPGSKRVAKSYAESFQAKLPTVVIALCDSHFEAVELVPEVGKTKEGMAEKMRKEARQAVLDTAHLDGIIPTNTTTTAPLATKLGHINADRVFCPFDGCRAGILSSSDAVGGLSRKGLLQHMRRHQADGAYIPDELLGHLGMSRCANDQCDMLLPQSKEVCNTCTVHFGEEGFTAPSPSSRGMLTDQDDLPSFEVMGTTRIQLKGGCPDKHLQLYSELFLRVLMDILEYQDEVAWKRLALFFTVLHRTRTERGGKDQERRLTSTWGKDLEAWKAGQYVALWEQTVEERKPRPSGWSDEDTDEGRRKRTIAKARAGLPSQAMSCATSDGLAPQTPATLEKLQTKHPAAADSKALEQADWPQPQEVPPVTVVEVMKALRSMPKSSAAGPSNVTGAHLRTLCLQRRAKGTLAALAAVLTSLARGNAPVEVAEFFAGANLVALRKPAKGPGLEEDVRPIAVGDTLRRLVGKILSARVRVPARTLLLRGNQVGVATARGAAVATDVISQYAVRNRGKGKVILKIDYRNAFNCVDRLSMLRAVDANLPELAPWVRWCYLEPSSLFYGGDTIRSQRGAQQGDPLGPLLFSLTIHQMALELKGHPGLDGTLWYLDDGSLRGSPKAVFEAYQVLCTRSSELGLEVNANKCELISTGGVSKEDLEAVGFTLNEGGQDAMGEGGFRLLDVDGFDFLGIPIGSAAFCEEYMAQKVDDSRRNLEALVDLGDSQAAFYVLRYCEGYCRMVFYMRGIPQCAEYLTAFDDLIDRCLAALLHDPDGALPELARAQAALPVALGGLGIRRTVDHRTAASLASQSGNLQLSQALDPAFTWDEERWNSAAEEYNSRVPVAFHVDRAQPKKILEQQSLSSAVIDAQADKLMQQLCMRDRARMKSLLLPLSGTYLTATPSARNQMSSADFAVVTRFRLGVAIHAEGTTCSACQGGQKRVVMDSFGDHTFGCPYSKHRVARHNALRDSVYRAAQGAGLDPALEETVRVELESKKRPGDVYLPVGVAENGPRCLDITHVCPTLPSYRTGASKFVGWSAKNQGQVKREKHERDLNKINTKFSPIVFEAFGGAGDEANLLIAQLGGLTTGQTSHLTGSAELRIRESIAVAYQKKVASSFLERGAMCVGIATLKREPCVEVDVAPSAEDMDRFGRRSAGAVEPLCDDANPDDDMSRPADRTEEQQGKRKRDVKPDHVEPPRKRTGRFDSATVIPEGPGLDVVREWEFLRECRAAQRPRATEQAAKLGASKVTWSFVAGDCAFEALLFATGRTDLTVEGLRQAAVKKVQGRADLSSAAVPNFGVWQRLMTSGDRGDERTWADAIAVAGAGEALEVSVVILNEFARPSLMVPRKRPKAVVLLLHSGDQDAADGSGSIPGHYEPLTMDPALQQHILSFEATGGKGECQSERPMAFVGAREAEASNTFLQCEQCSKLFDASDAHFCCHTCGGLACLHCAQGSKHCPLSQIGRAEYFSALSFLHSNVPAQAASAEGSGDPPPKRAPSPAVPAPEGEDVEEVDMPMAGEEGQQAEQKQQKHEKQRKQQKQQQQKADQEKKEALQRASDAWQQALEVRREHRRSWGPDLAALRGTFGDRQQELSRFLEEQNVRLDQAKAADRHRVEELTARHKRELAEDAKKMHAQYLEDCDRHPEAGESLRAEYDRQRCERHYAIAAKHESEQKATTLLLTAVNLSRQLEAERMVAYGRCFGVVCEGRLFLPCHAVRRAVGDDPEGLEPDCVGDWMALFGPQGASPCPGEFLYCWATQQPWSGNGEGDGDCPESVVARQAVRKIAGEAGYCDTWGKTSAVIVVREGRVSWGTPSRDQLEEEVGRQAEAADSEVRVKVEEMDDDEQEQEEDLDTAMEGADRSHSLSVEGIPDQKKQARVRELLRAQSEAWMWTEEERTERGGLFPCLTMGSPVPSSVTKWISLFHYRQGEKQDGRPLLSLPLSTATFTQWYEVMKVVGLHEWSVQEKCKAKSTLHALTDNRSSRGQAFAAESTRRENEARAAREGIGRQPQASSSSSSSSTSAGRGTTTSIAQPAVSTSSSSSSAGRGNATSSAQPAPSPAPKGPQRHAAQGRSNTSNVFTDAVAQATQHVLSPQEVQRGRNGRGGGQKGRQSGGRKGKKGNKKN